MREAGADPDLPADQVQVLGGLQHEGVAQVSSVSHEVELLVRALSNALPGMSDASSCIVDDAQVADLWKIVNSEDSTQHQKIRSLHKTRSLEPSDTTQFRGIFQDPEAMKEKMRRGAVKEEYNVKIYYKTKGIWPFIATSPKFEIITLIVIGLNSVWLWIDCDMNDEPVLTKADWGFQAGEHLFCTFFFFEWLARFLSFADKKNCVKDAWFVFDTILVGLMVFETWIMTIVLLATEAGGDGGGGVGNTSMLRLLRLMRLTRISRLVRLMRAMPELLFMIKGMMAATRGVFFTMVLLLFILYVFGIVMRLLSNGTAVGNKLFPSVHISMYWLILHGVLVDDSGPSMQELTTHAPACAFAYALVIILAALTMMNMLVGVLCEVVSAVAATEKEELAVSLVRSRIQGVLKETNTGAFSDGKISKEEFVTLLGTKEGVGALRDVGVDVSTLVDYADVIFQSDKDGKRFDKKCTFNEFMDLVLQLRDTNSATVKDVTALRKFIHGQNTERNVRLQKLDDNLYHLEDKHDRLAQGQILLERKVKLLRLALEPMLGQDRRRLASLMERGVQSSVSNPNLEIVQAPPTLR